MPTGAPTSVPARVLARARALLRTLTLLLVRGVAAIILGLGLAVGSIWLARPSRTPLQHTLFQGVEYSRLVRSVPRPLMIHLVQVDLTVPGVRVRVTPGEPAEGREVRAQTTRAFLRAQNVQLAINGSFFEPFHSEGIDDYYPHSGDPVDVIGETISGGIRWSKNDGRRPTLCILEARGSLPAAQAEARAFRARIVTGACPAGTQEALAGHALVLSQGQPVTLKSDKLEPRSLVGTDQEGKTLWLLVVDGRQDGYSEGISLPELALLTQELGMTTALNLDGGGSSTLASARWGYPELLNSPIHTRIPMRERPVANHLGIIAPPLP